MKHLDFCITQLLIITVRRRKSCSLPVSAIILIAGALQPAQQCLYFVHHPRLRHIYLDRQQHAISQEVQARSGFEFMAFTGFESIMEPISQGAL